MAAVSVLSQLDVINMLMEWVAGVSMTSTNCERQSAALLQASNIPSNVVL